MATSTTLQPPPAATSADRERTLDAYRRWGYLEADLDPLGRMPPAAHAGLPAAGDGADQARRWYCGTLAAEFAHIADPERRAWLEARLETEPPAPERERTLDLLMRSELFEQFLQTRYTGNKRFSIEGVAALIPLLDAALDTAGAEGAEQAVLAMSHRGRLNVIVNIVGKTPAEVFAGFEDVDPKSTLGGGDVKYHLGATGEFSSRGGRQLFVHLNSNPSHLEAVDPVAMGRTRAKQDRLGDAAGKRVVPIVMHGDAAFAGQGVLAETLNLASIPGFAVGGTLHVIVNNLIGFTTDFDVLHSSRFAADVAKRLPIPIFHVNGEDPDAVVRGARLAMAYRYAFQSDVVLDLIGYRRYGHSEVDDPTITQPLLFRKIKAQPPLWKSYAERTGADPAAVARRAEEIAAGFAEGQQQAAALARKPILRYLS
jgi:2-oxoglutarate dehydrogenase E1 component